MKKWKSLGLLFEPDGTLEWNCSHAMMPCIYKRSEKLFDIYFSARDSSNRSQGSMFTLTFESETSFSVSNSVDTPILALGSDGKFDDAGIMPTSIVRDENKWLIYYNGWTLKGKYPFTSFNGAAIRKNEDSTFEKLSDKPTILFANDIDPISTFAPFVLKEQKGWKMWYVSCRKWEKLDSGMKHFYHIRYATSNDGLNWQRDGHVCIDFQNEWEYAIARPCVVKINHLYHMLFSYRASKTKPLYQMGMAVSKNGKDWTRLDKEFEFEPSGENWDKDMQCYGVLFEANKQWYMLYNGNHYGKTGIGLAKCID